MDSDTPEDVKALLDRARQSENYLLETASLCRTGGFRDEPEPLEAAVALISDLVTALVSAELPVGEEEVANTVRALQERRMLKAAALLTRLSRENAELRAQLERLEIKANELVDLRRINEAGFKEAYRMLGIEDDGEYRWKWLLLELSKAERRAGGEPWVS